MPRPLRRRRVWFQPGVTYFKPAGVRMVELDEIVLTVEECEAIRLKDFLGMEQGEAAKKMNISQPTFNRLLRLSRKKISDALVNGKAIRIEGGVYKMVQPRMRGRRGFGAPPVVCVCPVCGVQAPKQRGVPCASVRCPKCGGLMRRG